MGKKNENVKIACENRKARHDYFIHETYEAGLELALASGKHNYDKRQSLRAKDAKREMEQALKARQRG